MPFPICPDVQRSHYASPLPELEKLLFLLTVFVLGRCFSFALARASILRSASFWLRQLGRVDFASRSRGQAGHKSLTAKSADNDLHTA